MGVKLDIQLVRAREMTLAGMKEEDGDAVGSDVGADVARVGKEDGDAVGSDVGADVGSWALSVQMSASDQPTHILDPRIEPLVRSRNHR